MRALPLLALALLGAACPESATAPLAPSRTVSDAAPSGLAVASARGPWKSDADLRAASATVTGDSVVLTYVSGNGCGQTFAPSAGLVDGVLVVTDVGRTPAGVAGCLDVNAFATIARPPCAGARAADEASSSQAGPRPGERPPARHARRPGG